MSDCPVEDGQKWRKKRNRNHVTVVLSVDYDEEFGVFGGYVVIDAPWISGKSLGKSMDTFLKQYERV